MLVVGAVDPLILVAVLDLVAAVLGDLQQAARLDKLDLMELLEQVEVEAALVLEILQTLEGVVVMALSLSLILLDEYQKN